jgi:hypothetical protein
MNQQTKEDIIDVLLVLYHVPGQYSIGALTLFYIWLEMKDWNPWANILLFFIFFFLFLEIITPLLAGRRLLNKIKKNINKFLKKIKISFN